MTKHRPPFRTVIHASPKGYDILSCGHTLGRVLRSKEAEGTIEGLRRNCVRCRTRSLPAYITGTPENRALLKRAKRARRSTSS